MASLREIRRRIKSIGSTSQITRAMQMVAASKMRKAQQTTLMTRPFAQLMYRIQRTATTHAHDFTHPLMEVRPIRKTGVILVGTDKGLCGSLNANLFRVAAQFDPATTVWVAVGKRAAQFLARTKRHLAAEFTCTDSPRFAEARPIAGFGRDMFLKGEVDEVKVIATRFINTMSQQAGAVEFLPIGEIKSLRIPGAESEAGLGSGTEMLFEPDPETLLSFLLGHYINIFIFRALLEAKASEQSARMVAMTGATDSATELIRSLTLEYNKLRQGNITRELLEIAGGQLGND
ncbi:MAG TPA: ATP synthase F1 subunit gamma [Verrucomicrobiae bacterium]|nr:ATP synthase F1 subunit gamma [Verrucomicrobiae bacterium]